MKPVIYQLFPRLYTNLNSRLTRGGDISQNGVGKMNQITTEILTDLHSLGATHVWLTGVIEHATATDYSAFGIASDNPAVVKGKAGSPYAIKDYYDIDPDIAENIDNRIDEFKALLRRIHDCGMCAVIDFVPNHVARHYVSDAKPSGVADFGTNDRTDWFFAHDNNFYYMNEPLSVDGVDISGYCENPARATGNDCFSPRPHKNDWYETVKLNYGIDYSNGSRHFDPIPDTWHKMLHILRYWAEMGIDGFRCDMAFMVPVEFWRWAIPQIKAINSKLLFIAEIYDVDLYRTFIDAGFDYLYDKVNLYDMLVGIERQGWHADAITSCWQRVDGIEPHMLNFLENHDEVRFASSFYAHKAENALPSLVVSALLGTGAFMVYQGQELGEKGEDDEGFSGPNGRTTIFDYWSIKSVRDYLSRRATKKSLALRATYSKVLNLCNSSKAISDGGFFDLTYANYDNPSFSTARHFAFLRHYDDEVLLIVVNFDDKPANISVNIPAHAFEHIGLAEGNYSATDIIGGSKQKITLSHDAPVWLHLKAKGAKVLKLAKFGAK